MEILWLGFYQAILYFSINSKWHQQKSTRKAVYCGATQLQQSAPPEINAVIFLIVDNLQEEQWDENSILQTEPIFVVPFNTMAAII